MNFLTHILMPVPVKREIIARRFYRRVRESFEPLSLTEVVKSTSYTLESFSFTVKRINIPKVELFLDSNNQMTIS